MTTDSVSISYANNSINVAADELNQAQHTAVMNYLAQNPKLEIVIQSIVGGNNPIYRQVQIYCKTDVGRVRKTEFAKDLVALILEGSLEEAQAQMVVRKL